MTKSILPFRFSSIHLNVALIREIGESQSVVSAPSMPAGPSPRWQASSSSDEEWYL